MDHSALSIVQTAVDRTGSVTCPRCNSCHCQPRATARRAGLVVGGIAGAIIGVGLIDGEKQSSITTVEMIGRAIMGFSLGAIAGYLAGTDIDLRLLGFYRCFECNFEFEV